MIEPLGAALILIGLLLMLFSRPFSEAVIRGQNSFWGRNLGKEDLKKSIVAMRLMSALFLVIGTLIFLKVIQ